MGPSMAAGESIRGDSSSTSSSSLSSNGSGRFSIAVRMARPSGDQTLQMAAVVYLRERIETMEHCTPSMGVS